MKYIFLTQITLLLLFVGCSKQVGFGTKHDAEILFENLPKTYLSKSEFKQLPNWEEENYSYALNSFINSCNTSSTREIYKDLCKKATEISDAKAFLEKEFDPYEINSEDGEKNGLLTGYYEPNLKGSLVKTDKYKYPIYETPSDLIVVDLTSLYPELDNFRLRGRLNGNRLIPYYTRKESKSQPVNAKVICYTDSEIDLFFLEVQGSGRVTFENNETIFLSYDNQNGHKYRSIGKYLVEIEALKIEEVSLQSIKAWLEKNPNRIEEVLNHNNSVVYFKQSEHAASGSLGVILTSKRSIAVDRTFIPLGSMLYLNANVKDKSFNSVVQAQDTGGAIKGAVRADLFLGHGNDAMEMAGELRAPLKLWILLPKEPSWRKKEES